MNLIASTQSNWAWPGKQKGNMVEKFKPYTLPRDKATELAQHRQNLLDSLQEYDKLQECGVDCRKDRAEFEDEIARIDKVLGGFAPKPITQDGTR